MNYVFMMDPLGTVKFDKDTSFMLMVGARERGHSVFFCPKDGISLLDGKVVLHTRKVTPQRVAHKPFLEEDAQRLTQDDVHALFIRPDPPFDDEYLMNTWLLDHLPGRIPVINRPGGIRSVNEKIWCSRFTDLVPATLVSANETELLAFIAKHKNIIAKPANAFGGQSVFHIEQGHTNTKVILETLSRRYEQRIILQKYVPEATNGDKRILLLNGEVLGAVLRVHGEGDHRNNFYAGGKATATTVTQRDKEIVERLKPHLLELGLYFVGIDILGDHLIEVNVTSPTCLQEMNNLYNQNLENKVITFVEGLCRS